MLKEALREYPEIGLTLEGFEGSIWQEETGGTTETTVTAFLWWAVLKDATVGQSKVGKGWGLRKGETHTEQRACPADDFVI